MSSRSRELLRSHSWLHAANFSWFCASSRGGVETSLALLGFRNVYAILNLNFTVRFSVKEYIVGKTCIHGRGLCPTVRRVRHIGGMTIFIFYLLCFRETILFRFIVQVARASPRDDVVFLFSLYVRRTLGNNRRVYFADCQFFYTRRRNDGPNYSARMSI